MNWEFLTWVGGDVEIHGNVTHITLIPYTQFSVLSQIRLFSHRSGHSLVNRVELEFTAAELLCIIYPAFSCMHFSARRTSFRSLIKIIAGI